MKNIAILSIICFLSCTVVNASSITDPVTKPTPNQFTKPSFPGGNEALFSFIEENLVYPAEARELRKEGVVQVRLYIDQDGKVVNTIVKDCETPCFQQSVLDLVEKMPRWTPAQTKGRNVKAGINLNIKFELED